ncbi:hypothetical protein FDP41_005274 [Naegleria fowleri]|uniref:Uncharacterized protein n=1 Tax=Naegleria fowleri TaxID=5763 RepID=A0A6A5BG33_NAEFO|nr:uncharacterized protein FDP41_005274 [Naegleria fowleri]KAF0975947.1 hypothetical protein FDP41_005274 [Naegleria fowleri]CAG4718731.1 unnamed protein product [Naegleria fowleri]
MSSLNNKAFSSSQTSTTMTHEGVSSSISSSSEDSSEYYYPGRYRFVDYWADSILNFTMRDEQTAIYDNSAAGGGTLSESPFSKYLSGLDGLKIVMKSSSMGANNIPTNAFQQEQYIPYLQLEEEGGFDRQVKRDLPDTSNQSPYQMIIPLRFHDEGLKNFTFMLRRLSTVKQFLVSSILAHNVESLFGPIERRNELVRRIMASPLDIRAHLYPDTTFSMCLKLGLAPYVIQHEMRLPNLISNSSTGKGWINDTLFSIKSKRGHTDIFQSFTSDSSTTALLGLYRAYRSKNVTVDLGGSILARDFIPGNLTYAARLGIISPLSHKKTAIVLNGSLLGHIHLSFTTQLSKLYGIAASAQLRYNSTNLKAELGVGLECISPPQAEDYAVKFRVDTEKGIACMLEKKRFWNNDKMTMGVSIANTTPIDNTYGPLVSDLKLGLNLQIEY